MCVCVFRKMINACPHGFPYYCPERYSVHDILKAMFLYTEHSAAVIQIFITFISDDIQVKVLSRGYLYNSIDDRLESAT